jgi:hypothetical protein
VYREPAVVQEGFDHPIQRDRRDKRGRCFSVQMKMTSRLVRDGLRYLYLEGEIPRVKPRRLTEPFFRSLQDWPTDKRLWRRSREA